MQTCLCFAPYYEVIWQIINFVAKARAERHTYTLIINTQSVRMYVYVCWWVCGFVCAMICCYDGRAVSECGSVVSLLFWL